MTSNFIKRRMTLFSQMQKDSLLQPMKQKPLFNVRYQGKEH